MGENDLHDEYRGLGSPACARAVHVSSAHSGCVSTVEIGLMLMIELTHELLEKL